MYNVELNTDLKKLVCTKCDYTEPLPTHCHKPMIIEDGKLVCWKGEHAPCCGSSSIKELPEHHGERMILKN